MKRRLLPLYRIRGTQRNRKVPQRSKGHHITAPYTSEVAQSCAVVVCMSPMGILQCMFITVSVSTILVFLLFTRRLIIEGDWHFNYAKFGSA